MQHFGYRAHSIDCDVPVCIAFFQSSGFLIDDLGLHELSADAASDVYRHADLFADCFGLYRMGL